MVEKALVQEKIQHIEQNIGKLELLAALPKETFLEHFYYIESGKHLLQVTIEAMLDICHHIIARKRYRTPDNYADAFVILIEEGILPESKKNTFISMAKFRNRVVHLYHEVGDFELYNILKEDLGDFRDFIKAVMVSII